MASSVCVGELMKKEREGTRNHIYRQSLNCDSVGGVLAHYRGLFGRAETAVSAVSCLRPVINKVLRFVKSVAAKRRRSES